MGDQIVTDPPSQPNRFSNSFAIASSSNGSDKDRGYTIVVPANVCFGGVSMQLDLKIDQKTLAAASDISKAVEEAVSTHFNSANPTTTTVCTQSGASSATVARRVVRVPSSTQSQLSFSISEPSTINGSTRMDCDCSNQNSSMVTGESREQVNEVCSSTVDSSPLCDTASSPIQIDAPSTSGTSQSSAHNDFRHDDQRPSSSAVCDNEVHSSMEDSGEPSASTSNFASGSTQQSHSPAPSSVDAASPSPQTTAAPVKRRRDKSTPPSHFCEQNDPGGKGQCRQRAILSYRYCIRHILLDPNAPYRQCQHKRKPKSKKDTNLYCTNAIRSDKDTVYCSTHMIMNGMMEPKRKKTSNGLTPSEVAPSVPESDPTPTVVTWSDATDGVVQQQPIQQTPLQPLPSIIHCGFEQSQQRRISEEADRWMVDSCGSVNSPMITSDMPSVEAFSVKEPTVQPFDAVVNTVAYPPAPPSMVVAQAPPTPLMHRNASCPPSVPPPSNMSSASFDEAYSLPSNTPQVIDDSPCSSSMLSPSPVKHVIGAPQPHPIHQSCSASNLTKQHPQLAAKLLQTPSVSSGSYTVSTAPLPAAPVPIGAPQVQQIGNAAIPIGAAPIPIGAGPVPVGPAAPVMVGAAPALVGATTAVPVAVPPTGQTSTLVGRPEFVRNTAVASPAPPQNAILPWSAPLMLQRPPSAGVPKHYSLDELDDEEVAAHSPPPPKKKVIRLKQKRQRMKMVGAYRKIPAVDQMCKMLEDADFDRTDLFPLGLEPSDDESSESDCDIMHQWPTPMERRCEDNNRSSGALEVYLLKKQLRLDRHTLLRQAQLNAPVMLASKKYPNSAGAALADRASRCGARRPSLLRRCTHVLTNGCGETVRCTETCLPMSNQCPQHILYNIHQKLFSYCSESCCGQPVLFVNSLFTSGLCRYHYELSQKEAEKSVVEREGDLQSSSRPGGIPPISFLQQPQPECTSAMAPPPPYAPLKRDVQMNAYNAADITGGVPNMQRNPEVTHIADFNESEGVETDVSLASVAKELGFDGRELSDMLAGLPADETDTDDILHDHFSQGLKEDEVVATAEMDDLGHSWADVEQFLLSEGYPVDLTPPPFTSVDSPNGSQIHPANNLGTAAPSVAVAGYLTAPSPTTTNSAVVIAQQQQPPQPAPRTNSIPTAENLLPHRS